MPRRRRLELRLLLIACLVAGAPASSGRADCSHGYITDTACGIKTLERGAARSGPIEARFDQRSFALPGETREESTGATCPDATKQIDGATTGAFVREMTCAGFQGIRSYLTLPGYSSGCTGDQPWVYYGLSIWNGQRFSLDVEAGMAYQKGNGTSSTPERWRPYLRLNGMTRDQCAGIWSADNPSFCYADNSTSKRVVSSPTQDSSQRSTGSFVLKTLYVASDGRVHLYVSDDTGKLADVASVRVGSIQTDLL
jgi:hypothetical protein